MIDISLDVKKADLFRQLKCISLAPDNCIKLTKREIECFVYWLHRYTAKEIAEKIGISYRTVEVHLQHIRTKINCHCRTQAIQKITALPINTAINTLFHLLT